MEKEQYENVIALLKQALQFYATSSNWKMKYNLNDELVSQMEMDEGEHARKTLKQVEELELMLETLGNDYEKLIQDAQNQDDFDQDELLKSLKDKLNEGNTDQV